MRVTTAEQTALDAINTAALRASRDQYDEDNRRWLARALAHNLPKLPAAMQVALIDNMLEDATGLIEQLASEAVEEDAA